MKLKKNKALAILTVFTIVGIFVPIRPPPIMVFDFCINISKTWPDSQLDCSPEVLAEYAVQSGVEYCERWGIGGLLCYKPKQSYFEFLMLEIERRLEKEN